jgi:hypothetical protein
VESPQVSVRITDSPLTRDQGREVRQRIAKEAKRYVVAFQEQILVGASSPVPLLPPPHNNDHLDCGLPPSKIVASRNGPNNTLTSPRFPHRSTRHLTAAVTSLSIAVALLGGCWWYSRTRGQ